MKQKMTWHARFASAVGSKQFFWFTVALFVVEAAWIAVSARYPQAFDEQFHLGITQLYAHQWSPFFAAQPAGTDRFGALTADPSFLYHYLLSFPYRLLTHLTSSLTAQVIVLRFLNIGLFAWALVLFRKLLLHSPASKALVHTSLLFFILIPVVPLLASQITYDNLFIPLCALSLLWAVVFIEKWQTDERFPLEKAVQLLLLGLFASTVKYAFLPVLAALVVIIVYVAWRSRHGLVASLIAQLKALNKLKLAIYIVLALVAAILWGGVYGRNTLDYHIPLPNCSKVLSVERCTVYAPWGRNYNYKQQSSYRPPLWMAVPYTGVWIYESMQELIFTISSNFESDGVTVDYYTNDPLPMLLVMSWAVLAAGVVLVIRFRKRLWSYKFFRVCSIVILFYALALWLQNFQDYLHTGHIVAVHGRYMLEFIPVMFIAVGLGFSWLLHSPRFLKSRFRMVRPPWLVIVALIFFIQGGGDITYIVRSSPSWFWNQNSSVAKANKAIQRVLDYLVVGD